MNATPTAEPVALAIDLGTGGPKVAYVTLTGRLLWHTHRTVPTTWIDGGGAEQDARGWWQTICGAARDGLASGAVVADEVVAVAVTGQWDSTIPVGADCEPVGPCILWMDHRGAAHIGARFAGFVAGYKPGRLVEWVRKTGGIPGESDAIGHILHLEIDRPEIATNVRWYLEPVDYITARFTGSASASHASQTGLWLTDNRKSHVLEYDRRLVAKADVPIDKLPPLRPNASIVGTVRDDVADLIGLPHGVEVIAGMPDLHAAVLGAGGMGMYEAHLALSTSAWISAPVPMKKTDALRQITSIPGFAPGQYLIVNNHDTGGASLEWLRDAVYGQGGVDAVPFDEFLAPAAEAPVGSRGVIFTPWLKGIRTPAGDGDARAGFHNLGIDAGRPEIIRAVLEGVAYQNRWMLAGADKFAKRPLDRIRLLGGGANSLLWCQIHADVLGRTVERVVGPQFAQVRGMGIAAGLALGALRPEEVRDLIEVDAVLEPDPAAHATYSRLYEEFLHLYPAQKAIFKRLARPVR